jgi:3',5'-cyclic AMP phosphodiesterase CpdA
MVFRLAHLSDPHIGPLPRPTLRELMGKRATGYVNWRRGRWRIHDMDMLDALVADMRAHRPDHVAMTGDVLNIGLPAEFPLARAWLESLGGARDVSFVPGNHDAYVRASLPYLARFEPFFAGDDGASGFPYLRVRGPVAIVGLNSAIPRPMFVSSGRVGAAQLARAESLLAQAGARGLARVVLLHHPPLVREQKPGRSLIDATAFEAMIARVGAELILHGHDHRQATRHMQGPRGGVPVVGVASASVAPTAGHRPAAWHLFEFHADGGGVRIAGRARGAVADGAGIVDLGALPLTP